MNNRSENNTMKPAPLFSAPNTAVASIEGSNELSSVVIHKTVLSPAMSYELSKWLKLADEYFTSLDKKLDTDFEVKCRSKD